MLHTTFRLAEEHWACKESYRTYAAHVGGIRKFGKDTPIPLASILDVLGLEDTLWCLRAVLPEEEEQRDKISRLLTCDYAEHVLPIYEKRYPDDLRPQQTIEVSRRFANGAATGEELAAARAAAWVAARGAGVGAMYAARAAARAAYAVYAAETAAYAAYVAWDAARSVAWDAAMATATYTAENAEQEWQKQRFREYLKGDAEGG